ncbi:Ail/Lom family outer membrane beta-barrel protein [Xenorhabdus bovienii]|uniref:Attachment invasion locus protein n=2 Tax=Xenorhabdus bovienii TaxID=40576 RepID=A0A0B6X702_XENBV|nr:Ail/Lom family outer membrane beta-barrel protein [Xenorhabdus bovienii]MCG3472336.1 outer membrane beta-barrel protein [Xenorhabdus bovienii]CDH03764.1 Attachment invasion locus protein [Xenorhabdus bovienii str. feltiae Moldova]CDM89692.1 Attachment invasion locus protein [Xenorhabdus bovienii]
MKKLVLASLVAAGMSIVSMGACAAGESTISAGYAQSHVKSGGDKLKENPKGFNIKYRYEFDNNWSVIGSLAYTHQGYEYYYGGHKTGTVDLDYYSLTAGPAYRINEYVSAYGLVGSGHGKVEAKNKINGSSHSENKTELAYAAGLQINPIPNIAIDASYEYSKLGEVKVGTWMIGVGYRF